MGSAPGLMEAALRRRVGRREPLRGRSGGQRLSKGTLLTGNTLPRKRPSLAER